MKESDSDCCARAVFGCFPDFKRKKKSSAPKSPENQDSPGGSVQAFYRQNRGKSCRQIMRFNGYPNKVSETFLFVYSGTSPK